MSQPRIRIGVIVQMDNRILMVEHRKGDRSYWLLPGGGLENGERLEDGCRREMREETGIDVRLDRVVLLAETIAPDGGRHVLHVVTTAEILAVGEPTDHDPILGDRCWYRSDELENLDIRPAIRSFLQAGLADGWPTGISCATPDWIEEKEPTDI